MKNQSSTHVEIKTVTWSKDSHGLFDYESKNVNFNKTKIENSSKIYKAADGSISVECITETSTIPEEELQKESENYLFSVCSEGGKNERFYLKVDGHQDIEQNKNNLFLIVRSLKNEDGIQKGYPLELGDVIRLGRIEYRVIEFQDTKLQKSTLLGDQRLERQVPFSLVVKNCDHDKTAAIQCKICFRDYNDTPEPLVNPCNCKGSVEYVHIKCLQDWINSKVKKKVNPSATCFYWKKLNCEICKVSLPDLVEIDNAKKEIVPIFRPDNAYIILERVFYDKSKETGENSKTMILLSLSGDTNQIKLGRGHECDLRENDISVSRLHAYIKYENGQFIVIDNNSKFGTLILLRKNYNIEKKKMALQIGRTVITFSLKHSSVNNVPVFKNPMLMEKFSKWQSPKNQNHPQPKSSVTNGNTRHKSLEVSVNPEGEKPETTDNLNPNNGSFLD